MHRFFAATAVILGLGIVVSAAAQSSPFLRSNSSTSSAATTAAANESGFQFTGVITMGSETVVCITEEATQRSHWIKVGQTVAGIRVSQHNADAKQVTIKRGGREMNLTLKSRTIDPATLVTFQPGAVSAGPVPVAEVNIPVAITNEQKEVEARMLVSDLLEIGMIQRKAYEEAKRAEVEARREELKQSASK